MVPPVQDVDLQHLNKANYAQRCEYAVRMQVIVQENGNTVVIMRKQNIRYCPLKYTKKSSSTSHSQPLFGVQLFPSMLLVHFFLNNLDFRLVLILFL